MPADPVSCHEPELRIIRNTLRTVAQNDHLLGIPEIRDFLADQCRAAKPAMRRLVLAARDAELAGYDRTASTIGAAAMLFEAIINPQLKLIDGRPATRPGDLHFWAEINTAILAIESIIEQAARKACDASRAADLTPRRAGAAQSTARRAGKPNGNPGRPARRAPEDCPPHGAA